MSVTCPPCRRPRGRLVTLALALAVALVVQVGPDPAHVHGAVPSAFAQAISWWAPFTGSPSVALPWRPPDWDVSVHSRDVETWDRLQPMAADHGPQCQPPPSSHVISSYADAVFQCNDHVMTAIRADAYGVIVLMPNQAVDFATGEGVVRFDMSTFRTSGRDWVTLWVSPFEDHLQLPLADSLPDLNGEPRRAVQIDLSPRNAWTARVIRDHRATDYEGQWYTGYDELLVPSATVRTPFELRISRTHIKFGAPSLNFWWLDEEIPDLGWSRGVMQLQHHSYTPDKDCEPESPCRPNTWHWDNVGIWPAVPFTLIRAHQRRAEAASPVVTFPSQAPAGAFLRFVAAGHAIRLSLDDGRTWLDARRQPEERPTEDGFNSYLTAIPPGASRVAFRGTDWCCGPWLVQDLSIVTAPRQPSACSPRPPVRVTTTRGAPGRLNVSVAVDRPAGAPDNALYLVKVGQPSNGQVQIGGQVLGAGDSHAPGFGAQRLDIQVARQTPGAAMTVPLSVYDDCGEWRTFVGGGPTAF